MTSLLPFHRAACISCVAAFLGTAFLLAPRCAAQDRTAVSRQGLKACTSLASLALPDTTITLAKEEVSGTNPAPAQPTGFFTFTGVLPVTICRVAGTIKPTPASHIKFEVWMPVAAWNGKYNGVGNGGLAGFIAYSDMAAALARGYATGSTDTGHEGQTLDGSWMLNHQELVMDFVRRSQHLTAQAAKAVVAAYYGTAPSHAYFSGCSNGGGQGMQEAQHFPEDYDGIVNGDAARDLTHEWPGELYAAWVPLAAQEALSSKMPALHQAVLAKCDRLDGVQDGVLEDPTRCTFDSAALQCSAGTDDASCLTASEVGWVKKIYRGIQDPDTGKIFWPGPALGSELRWSDHMHPGKYLLTQDYMRNFVYRDPSWAYTDPNFSFETKGVMSDLKKASATYGPLLDADNPDLRPFQKRGGKMILYHGWNDNAIAPTTIIDYYDRVVKTVGGSEDYDVSLRRTQSFARLFMVPGMEHCGGGAGPNDFDALAALSDWVEKGHAPEQIAAQHVSHGTVDRTRPLCPYPKTAVYRGSGSTDEATNFSCQSADGVK